MIPYEIERKFLIRYPDLVWLSSAASSSRIAQTYLLNDAGESERIRWREDENGTVYTHTRKQHINDLRRIEIEEEIDETSYLRLLARRDPVRRTIEKTRYCLSQNGFLYEIDVFPFWNDRAFLEIELKDEGQAFPWPDGIDCIRELTGDSRYSNYALALCIPQEDIGREE